MKWINKHLTGIALTSVILAVLWVIFGPFLLTQKYFTLYNFTGKENNTGIIGDTIGGITAPAVGLISIILLFLALLKQIENNRVSQNEANFKIIYQEICNAKNDINAFQFHEYFGKEAFENWSAYLSVEINMSNYTEPLLDKIEKVRLSIINIGRIIYLKEELKTNNEYNEFIKKEISYIYDYYLKNAHKTIDSWKLNHETETNNIMQRLIFEQTEWENMRKKITNLS